MYIFKTTRIVLNIIINLFICIKAFNMSGKATLQFQEQFQCYYIWSGRGIKLQGGIDRKGVWGRMDTCICMAESLCCSSETITTLLTGYTPIQNKKRKLWRGEKLQASITDAKPGSWADLMSSI